MALLLAEGEPIEEVVVLAENLDFQALGILLQHVCFLEVKLVLVAHIHAG